MRKLGILTRITDFFRTPIEWVQWAGDDLTSLCMTEQERAAYKIYAIEICVIKIAQAITKCEFETYSKGEFVRKDMWYMLNVSPNRNQNAAAFWEKVVRNMVWNRDGALIFSIDGKEWIVADDFQMEERALADNIYHSISANNLQIKKTFYEEDVIHITLGNGRVRSIVEGVYEDYGTLIGKNIHTYIRSNSEKLFVNIDSTFNQFRNIVDENGESQYDRIMQDVFNNRLKTHFGSGDSAVPVEQGLKYEKAQVGSYQGVGAIGSSTRDVTALWDDVINKTAAAFGIPLGVIKGDLADIEAVTDNFIVYCIDPIALKVEQELCRKLYGKAVLQGSKIKVKTNRVRGTSAVRLAAASEALARVGAVNPNWIRRQLGEEEIKEDWADEYLITKNYSSVGESDGKQSNGSQSNEKQDGLNQSNEKQKEGGD